MEVTYQLYIKSPTKPEEVMRALYENIHSIADINTLLKNCLRLYRDRPNLLMYDSDFFRLLLSVVIGKIYSIKSTNLRDLNKTLDALMTEIDDVHIEFLKRYINHPSVS